MDQYLELKLKAALAVIALVGLVLVRLPALRDRAPLVDLVHVAAAVLAVVAFFNFGWFRHHVDHGFVNQYEHFHYRLGSKYFAELGYDGLYVASIAAQEENANPLRPSTVVRDLRSNQFVRRRDLAEHQAEVLRGFTPDRWASFVADHEPFLRAIKPRFMRHIRLDHGYNPTPTWTFMGQLFGGRIGSGPIALLFLATLDLALLGAAFFFVFRTYGLHVGCLAIVLFGLGFGWRYAYVGAFMRLDWLSAVVIGVCMLEHKRPATAGALFGYATAVRLFPLLFLAGPAVLACRALARGERPSWVWRLGAGFGVALLVGFAVGCLTGRGPAAWTEFAVNIENHRKMWPLTRVDLNNVILNVPTLAAGFKRAELPTIDLPGRRHLWAELRKRRVVQRALQAALLVLLVAASWRMTLARSAVLGLLAIFTLTPIGCYYWIMGMLLALGSRTGPGLALLAVSAGLWVFQALHPSEELSDQALRFACMSVGLMVVLVVSAFAEIRRDT